MAAVVFTIFWSFFEPKMSKLLRGLEDEGLGFREEGNVGCLDLIVSEGTEAAVVVVEMAGVSRRCERWTESARPGAAMDAIVEDNGE